jgi:uncharacterized membrane protein
MITREAAMVDRDGEIRDGELRGADRTVTMTDAVVAIAMTLLVLPLVELVPEVEPDHFGSFVADHLDVFVSFVISFLVIYVFWSAHERAFDGVERIGPRLRVLNMWWLLVVAFLPFPTALVGRHVNTTIVPFYVGTMFVLSALTTIMIEFGHRARRRAGHERPRLWWGAALTWSTTAVFALCTLAGLVNGDAGLYGLLLLVVVRWAEGAIPRAIDRRRAAR